MDLIEKRTPRAKDQSISTIAQTTVIVFVIYSAILQLNTVNAFIVTKNDSIECQELSPQVLQEILGPAFNGRYMSLHLPIVNNDIHRKKSNNKRTVDFDEPFVVDDTFMDGIYDRPAWEVRNHAELDIKNFGGLRRKRSTRSYPHEWHCKSKISWLDLGIDYFPRYLRSVECLKKDCWFSVYHCKPRSFTVKLLRRKRDKCVETGKKFKTGVSGLPKELAELWVWEERAVTFCCDCKL